MTTPIKPPGQPSSFPEAADLERVDPAQPGIEEAAGEQAPVEQAAVEAAPGAPAAAPADAIGQLAASLRAGEVDAAGAVERILERVLAQGSVPALPAGQRAQLEAMLRRALADDPTLSRMVGDLGRD
jgi:hypothetical protein